jgi:hypothetical protein
MHWSTTIAQTVVLTWQCWQSIERALSAHDSESMADYLLDSMENTSALQLEDGIVGLQIAA